MEIKKDFDHQEPGLVTYDRNATIIPWKDLAESVPRHLHILRCRLKGVNEIYGAVSSRASSRKNNYFAPLSTVYHNLPLMEMFFADAIFQLCFLCITLGEKCLNNNR